MEEVKKLSELKLTGTKKKVRDTFIFTCMTGLRWSDLITLKKSNIKQENGVFYIDKISIKTRILVKIPLNDWCRDFIQSVDYNLNFLSNDKFNENLKNICGDSKLFEDLTKSEDENGRLLHRWEVISVHKGRHTFISNLVKLSVPINEIMKYTGHTKLETLMKYINTQTPITNEYVKKLDFI